MKLTNVNFKNDEVMVTIFDHVKTLVHSELFLGVIKNFLNGLDRPDVLTDIVITDEIKPFNDDILNIVNTVTDKGDYVILDDTTIIDISPLVEVDPTRYHIVDRKIINGEIHDTLDPFNTEAYINKNVNHLMAVININAESDDKETLRKSLIKVDLYQL